MDELTAKLSDIIGTLDGPMIVDALSHTISFATKYTVAQQECRTTVEFCGVAAYYFQAKRGNQRRVLYPPEEGDVLEIMEVIYYPNSGVGTIGFLRTEDQWAKNWTPKYHCAINFVVDMFDDCCLFIEADCVVINGQKFHVGYPELST